jgi:thioredoxin-related protein
MVLSTFSGRGGRKMYLVPFFVLAGAAAQETPPRFQLRDAVAEPEPAKLPWHASFDDALAVAAAEKRPLLLFFTARWCGYCHQLERKTLSQPKVREQLARFVPVKVDLDTQDGRTLATRYRVTGGIPQCVLVGPDGLWRGRVGGYLPEAEFLEELRKAEELAAREHALPADRHRERAELFLEREDFEKLELELAALRTNPADPAIEELGFRAAERLVALGRWTAAGPALDRFLQRHPDSKRCEQALLLQARVRTARTGTLDPVLERRLRDLISVLGTPAPRPGVVESALRKVGMGDPGKNRERVSAWVKRRNAAMVELRDLGAPAAPLLLEALESGPKDASDGAGTCLGWMRLPSVRPKLLALLDDPRQPARVRGKAATALGLYRDTSLAPAFAKLLADPAEKLEVRRGAVDGLHLVVDSGSADPEVGKALMTGARERDRDLRFWSLDTLMAYDGPVDLVAIASLLDDQRTLADGVRICDWAAHLLLKKTGKELYETGREKPLSSVSPEAAAFLRQWMVSEALRLRWNDELRRYVPR